MSIDAERAVIGAILLSPDCLPLVIDKITGDDFGNRSLATAFNIMVGKRALGDPIDELSVSAAMKERGQRVELVDLYNLRESTPTAANVDYYAQIVADAAGKRRMSTFGTRVAQLSESHEPYAKLMEMARAEWTALNSAGATGGDMYVPTLAELLSGPVDYDWTIPHLLERTDRLVITGGEGAGKTYFVQQIAILSAAGIHPTTFRHIDPVKVLVVDAENSDKQWRRRVGPLAGKAAREGRTDPRLTMRIKTVPRLNVLSEKDLGRIHRWIDEYTPDLLVIGPFYKLVPRAINSDDDAAPVIAALDGLRARGVALVMEAHAGKSTGMDGERNLAPRGSSALLGWPEFGFGIRLDKDSGDGAPREADLIRWRGDREERAWPNRLRRGGEWPWSDAEAEITAWNYQQAIKPKYA